MSRYCRELRHPTILTIAANVSLGVAVLRPDEKFVITGCEVNVDNAGVWRIDLYDQQAPGGNVIMSFSGDGPTQHPFYGRITGAVAQQPEFRIAAGAPTGTINVEFERKKLAGAVPYSAGIPDGNI